MATMIHWPPCSKFEGANDAQAARSPGADVDPACRVRLSRVGVIDSRSGLATMRANRVSSQVYRRFPKHTLSASREAASRASRLHTSNRARGIRLHRGQVNERLPFVPPEDWHEPVGEDHGLRIVHQPAGAGFRHVLTADEVRERLSRLPAHFVEPLEVVQFSRMTRKKLSFPCYGMQWGSSIYLYPIEDGLTECYNVPPKPSQVNEARMYGGQWIQTAAEEWKLVWTESAIKDFYLNNILIHELGHILDDRNQRPADRERYAEWFAIEYGYLPTQAERTRAREPIRRRHHAAHA